MRQDQRIVIIGAGPCGLGCARELQRLGHRNWQILERLDHAGGLASSVVDPQGFTCGCDGLREFMSLVQGMWALQQAEPQEFIPVDEDRVIVSRANATARDPPLPVEVTGARVSSHVGVTRCR